MGDKAREMMLDAVGLSFVPLYRIFGPISMLLLMLFFIIGITRIVLTIIVRAVIITRARGCGPWIFAAVWGTVYHVLITPVRWADDTARHIADNVGQQMEDEAAANADEVYPMGQLRQAKARALAAMGRQDSYEASATLPVPLSGFSYSGRHPAELAKEQSMPPGHSEV